MKSLVPVFIALIGTSAAWGQDDVADVPSLDLRAGRAGMDWLAKNDSSQGKE